MQGVCHGGVCICSPGHRGLYCEIPPTCAGVMDINGNCCPSSVISASGQCCTEVRRSGLRTHATVPVRLESVALLSEHQVCVVLIEQSNGFQLGSLEHPG